MPHTERMTTEQTEGRLFKADHPRHIDRHIAFFGDPDPSARDMCGEALLDALTHRSSDPDDEE